MDRPSFNERAARIAGLGYAWLAFALTFVFFTWLVLFLGNLPKASKPWVHPTVDIGGGITGGSLVGDGVIGGGLDLFAAAIIDIFLVALFGLQHSLMARPGFKAWWLRIVTKGLERSTYTMAAGLVGVIMLVFWQPIPIVIWHVPGMFAAPFWLAFAAGWAILFSGALSINIFELLGTRQAHAWYRGQPIPPLTLKTSWLYDWVRHPMYVGVLLGFWATPHMTVGHALMAATFTLYILIAMRYEERDLARSFGVSYQAWRERAARDRGRLLPGTDATEAR